eukprot:119853-Chlamydomonas_euryale.AAC.3
MSNAVTLLSGYAEHMHGHAAVHACNRRLGGAMCAPVHTCAKTSGAHLQALSAEGGQVRDRAGSGQPSRPTHSLQTASVCMRQNREGVPSSRLTCMPQVTQRASWQLRQCTPWQLLHCFHANSLPAAMLPVQQALSTIGKFSIKKKVGDKDQIFGSVSVKDVADAIYQQTGKQIQEADIKIPDIKSVGTYECTAKLHKDVTATFSVVIVKDKSLTIKGKK